MYRQTTFIQILIWSLLLSILIPAKAYAQLDSMYIGKYNQKLKINGSLFGNFLELSTKDANGENEFKYIPNNTLNAGIGISHKNLPFDISISHSIGIKGDEDYLKSKSFDLQLHKYGGAYVADIFIQKYKGLYINEPNISTEKANLPDLSIFYASLVGQYICNWKKFSYKAAYNQSEKQLKSAGSFLLGTGFYHFKISSDSSFVFKDKNNIPGFQCGINAGYAYNWVLKKNWLICGSTAIGANLGNENIKTFFNNNLDITPTFLARFSGYYNNENWSLGISSVINIISLIYSDNSEINLSGGRFKISYVQRIDLGPKINH